MIGKVSAEDIAIRGNGTGLEYMCPTRHFVYIFFNPVFQVSTAKNEINLFNNHILIVAPVTFAPAGAMTPSAEFLFLKKKALIFYFYFSIKTCVVDIHEKPLHQGASHKYPKHTFSWPASVAQLDAPSDWRPGGRGFNPRRGRQHSSMEIDQKYFLRSFSPFRWFKKGSCQFLVKECAQYLED